MPLTKTVVPVKFAGGLNQKTAEKLVMPGEFLALENCVRRKAGSVQKRDGYTALSSSVFGGGTLSAGTHLDVTGTDLIALGNEHLYSYSEASDTWIDKGTCATASVQLVSLVRNNNTQALADMACSTTGLTCAVYEDSSGGVRYSVFDDNTGAALVYNAVLDASGSRPRVVALNSSFVLAYVKSGHIFACAVGFGTPTTIGAANSIAIIGTGPWDLTPYLGYGIFACPGTTGVTVGYIDGNAVAGSPAANALPVPATILTGSITSLSACTVVADQTNQRLWTVIYGNTGVVQVTAWTPDLGTFVTTNGETVANVRNVCGTVRAADAKLQYWYELGQSQLTPYNSNAKNHSTKVAVATYAAGAVTVAASAAFLKSVGLASKPFERAGRRYVLVAYESALQPTYFLARDDGYIYAKFLDGQGGGLTEDSAGTLKSGLPQIFTDTDGNFACVVQVRNQLNISGGGIVLSAVKGIEKVALTLGVSMHGATVGKAYHLAGGMLLNYDGVAVAEHGFFTYPEDVAATPSNSGGALNGANTYALAVIYEWIDSRGQIHRSSPSIQYNFGNGTSNTITGSTGSVSVVVPTLRVTNKVGTTVNIVLYMSGPNATAVLQRYQTIANNPSSDTITFTVTSGTVTPASLQLSAQEILYTTGGVIENIVPPTASTVHLHKGRLFLGGVAGTNECFFSKSTADGEGVSFQDAVPLPIESDGGAVLAYASMDEKLILFKERHIYYESGEGPTDSGQLNDYFTPIRVSHDVGTKNPRSVVTTPKGVMFQSDKGIYLLTRNLVLQYIGAGVDDYNGYTVTSATLMSDQDEVRFTTAGGPCLVYNYYFGQWSTFVNYDAVGAVTGLESAYLHMKSDGSVHREVVGQYDDNGARYSMAIETGWLALAGLQGYGRVYKALLLGDFVSHHFCRVKIAYDYENSYTQTVYFNTQLGLGGAGTTYGNDGLYGAATPYGDTSSTVFQLSVQPMQQKCEAIKLRIEDIDTIGSLSGGSFSLVALTLEVGRKYGTFKLPAKKSM